MTSKEFVIKSIQKLVKDFPEVRCRYEYDAFSYSHYIEVKPKRQFESDLYAHYEIDLTLHFIESYPYESITFITEGSVLDLAEDALVINGELYGVASYLNQKIKVSFGERKYVNLPHSLTNSKPVISALDVESDINLKPLPNLEVCDELISDYNYAMAA